MAYKKKLTSKELKHLKLMGMNQKNFKLTFLGQAMRRKQDHIEPCFDCKAIAIKLGYDT